MKPSWFVPMISSTVAIVLAMTGLWASVAYPGEMPPVMTGLFVGSLAATTTALAALAMRLRRLELENEGLIEEVSQEFDRLKTRVGLFEDALSAPRAVAPGEPDAAVRRVVIK